MTARLLLVSLVSLVLAAGTAWADPDSGSAAPGLTPPAEPVEPVPGPEGNDEQPGTGESEWYGGGIILVDGLGVAATVLAFETASLEVLSAGGAILALGGPIVHLARGEKRNAAISLGLRLGLPVLGGVLGFYIADNNCDFNCSDGQAIYATFSGMVVGVAAASLIDIVAVAHTRSTRKRVQATTWAPQLGVTDSQVTAGIAGWF